MATRMALPGVPFYGVLASTPEEAESLIRAALSWCPGVELADQENGLDVTIKIPHRLSASTVLAGTLQVSAEPSMALRKKMARQVRAAIKQDTSFVGIHYASLGAIVTTATTSQLVTFQEGAVIVHAGKLADRQRALALAEIYSCLRPDGSPPLWWGHRMPGQSVRLGIAVQKITRDAVRQMEATEEWLQRSGLAGRLHYAKRPDLTLVGGMLDAGEEADEALLRLLQETGKVLIADDGQRITVPGGRDLMKEYFSKQGIHYLWRTIGDLFDRMAERKQDFVQVQGEDLVINLALLPDFSQHRGLKAEGVDAQITTRSIAVAEVYRVTRTWDQPEIGYWQPLDQLVIWIGWSAEALNSASVAAIRDRWEELSGQERIFYI